MIGSLKDIAYSKPGNDTTPFHYVLTFSNGSKYVGSASGIYRLRYYNSSARGTYPSPTKNELLQHALHTYSCEVKIVFCDTLDEARALEKKKWIDLLSSGATLLNCREYGHAGKWIEQDTVANRRRKEQLVLNGNSSVLHKKLLSNGKSRSAVKGVASRVLKKGQALHILDDLTLIERTEILNELGYAS